MTRSLPKKDSDAAGTRVREYLAALPPNARKRMKQMREIIRAVAPVATESFSYRMPGFRLDGRVLVYYASFTRHTSLFPMTAAIRRAHADALKGYKTSTGTVQFPLDTPLPVTLVRRLVKARIAEMRASRKAR